MKVNPSVQNSLQLVNFKKGINNSTYQIHSVTVFHARALCIVQENKRKRYRGTEGRREEGTKRRKLCNGEIISFLCKFQPQSLPPSSLSCSRFCLVTQCSSLRCVMRQKQLLGRLHLPLVQSKVASVLWGYSYNVPYVCLI